jgi:hypothetical protein
VLVDKLVNQLEEIIRMLSRVFRPVVRRQMSTNINAHRLKYPAYGSEAVGAENPTWLKQGTMDKVRLGLGVGGKFTFFCSLLTRMIS